MYFEVYDVVYILDLVIKFFFKMIKAFGALVKVFLY